MCIGIVSELELTARLDDLCLSMTEHALSGGLGKLIAHARDYRHKVIINDKVLFICVYLLLTVCVM